MRRKYNKKHQTLIQLKDFLRLSFPLSSEIKEIQCLNKWKFHLAAAFFIIVVLVFLYIFLYIFLPISIVEYITLSMAWWRMTLFVLTQECSLFYFLEVFFIFNFSFHLSVADGAGCTQLTVLKYISDCHLSHQ